MITGNDIFDKIVANRVRNVLLNKHYPATPEMVKLAFKFIESYERDVTNFETLLYDFINEANEMYKVYEQAPYNIKRPYSYTATDIPVDLVKDYFRKTKGNDCPEIFYIDEMTGENEEHSNMVISPENILVVTYAPKDIKFINEQIKRANQTNDIRERVDILELAKIEYLADWPNNVNNNDICIEMLNRAIDHNLKMLDILTKQPPIIPQAIEIKTETVSDTIFKNAFNSMSYEDIKVHFQKLTELKSKNGEVILTNEQLEYFIKMAFVKKETPIDKISINYVRGEIGTIRKFFYTYYTTCQFHYESSKHCKDKYVRLLSDYFSGFEFGTVSNNFNH